MYTYICIIYSIPIPIYQFNKLDRINNTLRFSSIKNNDRTPFILTL